MRDFINIVEAAQAGSQPEVSAYYLYHGTSAQYLPSIVEKGLVPQSPGPDGWPEFDRDHSGWNDYDDEDGDAEEEPLPPEAFEPRTFLTTIESEAEQYANNLPNPVLLRIDIGAADVSVHTGETDFRYEFVTDVIPPQFIDALISGKWRAIS